MIEELRKLCDEWEDRARTLWGRVQGQRVTAVAAGLSGEAAMLDGCANQLRRLIEKADGGDAGPDDADLNDVRR